MSRNFICSERFGNVHSPTALVGCGYPLRYLLAEGGRTLYVVFMGTKHIRDWLTDANVLQVGCAVFPLSVRARTRRFYHRMDINTLVHIMNTRRLVSEPDADCRSISTMSPVKRVKDLTSCNVLHTRLKVDIVVAIKVEHWDWLGFGIGCGKFTRLLVLHEGVATTLLHPRLPGVHTHIQSKYLSQSQICHREFSY